MLSYNDIAKIFEEIELRLIASLKRNLSRHKQEENKYGFDWTAWQAEKLRNIDKFRQQNAQIMNSYTGLIDSQTRQIMLDEFAQGVNGINVAVTENVGNAEIVREPQFFGVDSTKINKLMDDITHLEKQAETAVLRMTDDVYRQTLHRVQLAMSTGSMTLQQAIDLSVQDFLNQGINCIVYKNGRRVNIADYVRMALRTTATRANLQGQSAKIRALGYDTVIVSHYSMCSPTCLPWQGKPYIDDVFSEWYGDTRVTGDIVYGKSHYCGKWFPLLSSAIKGGLFHPNCRHTISMWRDGDPIPKQQDNSVNNRRYQLEQQQRALEREVRKAKRNVAGLSDPNNIKQAKKQLRQAQKNLREFIENTNQSEGATILRRDYGREKTYNISATLQPAPASSSNNQFVDIPKDRVTQNYRNEIQQYRKIEFDESDTVVVQRNQEINLTRVTSVNNNIYLSDNVNIKPKRMHEIDRNITETLNLMGISKEENLPSVYLINSEEMYKTAAASYNPIRNILFIDERLALYEPDEMPEFMNQFACCKDDRSSYVHELYHWCDAEAFRKKIGDINSNNYNDYIEFINSRSKKKLDKLQKKDYNIFTGLYSSKEYDRQHYYETYTEYRVYKLMKGKQK